MKSFLLLFSLLLFACSQEVFLTVSELKIVGEDIETNTLLEAKQLDLNKNEVDLCFCKEHFNIPYYLPTGSFFKDSVKTKECNWEVYPATVKCYEYDERGRVVRMKVDGSGVMADIGFRYDEKDRVIEMTSFGYSYCEMEYNEGGNLKRLVVDDSAIKRKITFTYE